MMEEVQNLTRQMSTMYMMHIHANCRASQHGSECGDERKNRQKAEITLEKQHLEIIEGIVT